jgi:hypothetical protein
MSDRNATVEVSGVDGGAIVFRLLRNNVSNFVNFNVNPSQLPALNNNANVTSYGDALRTALYSNPAVRAELEQMFGLAAPDRSYLDFAITNTDAEPIRWEALHGETNALLANNNNAFLALDGKCSLKRIAFTGAAKETGPRFYSLPLRMAAFLSASGVSAAAEFDAIASAVGEARRNGLEIEAHVYLGEQDLLTRATGDVAAGRLDGIRVEPIPSAAVDIEKKLLSEPFQIVHVFCHGRVEGGVQRLEFASISDHDTVALADNPAAQTGSIPLSIERLTEVLLKGDRVWLTVLNSCSGGASAPRQHSMASALARGASPVAIGMAEPIQAADANLFAKDFYGAAFELIGDAVKGLELGMSAMIDLGPAVAHARSALYAAAEADTQEMFGRWCLPVLYQRDAPLKVACADDDEMRARIATVAGVLRGMSITTPPELRKQLLAILDKAPAVPAGLRPGLFGEFA